MMECIQSVHSQVDNTVKHIFDYADQPLEASWINKNDGKHIICTPTQSSCNLGCTFCFLTDSGLAVQNLSPKEIYDLVTDVVSKNCSNPKDCLDKTLLISFMGAGEPLLNTDNILAAADAIYDEFSEKYNEVRFAIASIIPTIPLAEDFTELVRASGLDVKFHLSLHSPFDIVRKKQMPQAGPVEESIDSLVTYMIATGNATEIHYTMIAGFNDRDEDLAELVQLLEGKSIPIKFLHFSEKLDTGLMASDRIKHFRQTLESAGITTEFYRPPGGDIGSSCGQFLTETIPLETASTSVL